MRILLTANASYVPPRGGATRSNLVWLGLLAAAGHACRVVSSSLAHDPAGKLAQMEEEEISAHPIAADAGEGVEIVESGPITVYAAPDPSRRGKLLRQQIREFEPEWVLVSSEDLGQMLLREAHAAAPGRVIYLAHTPQLFPFGPASWNRDPHGAGLIRESAGIVAIGRHTANYIEEHAGRRPVVIHPPIYGHGPFEKYGSFDRGLITIINPCAVKGLPVFLALAGRIPEFEFGAVPGWGTTLADRRALQCLPNVRILPNVKHIEQVLRETRVLLMPSLWYEGFGLTVMEAMLRGVPVLASDSGGLREAKGGTRFILPVRPVERYEPVFDEHGLPKAVIPGQDIVPWETALRSLLSNRNLYEEESRLSRRAALEFVSAIRPAGMEEFLRSLLPASGEPGPGRDETEPPRISGNALSGLSDNKRTLLLQRLRKKATGRQQSAG